METLTGQIPEGRWGLVFLENIIFKGSWKVVLLSKSPDFLKSEAYAERLTGLYGVQLNLKLYWA